MKSYRRGIITTLFFGVAISGAFATAELPQLGEETIPDNEAAAIRELGLLQLQTGIYHLQGRRVQHTKGHACVTAEFTVKNDIPAQFKHGVFAAGKTFRATIRFSNGAGFDDDRAEIHGMAIKLEDVGGARLLDAKADPTNEQDFLLIDSPIFFAKDVEQTVLLSKILTARKTGGAMPKADPQIMKEIGDRAASLRRLPKTVVQTYFSAIPYMLGPAGQTGTAVKYEAIPTSEVADGKTTEINELRTSLQAILKTKSIEFDFAVRPQQDPKAQPIEDPTVKWTTEPVVLAHIKIMPQDGILSPVAQEKCERLSFNPWRGRQEHRPLGGISRARKQIYLDSANLRASQKD